MTFDEAKKKYPNQWAVVKPTDTKTIEFVDFFVDYELRLA